jgi:hypothetical protein
MTSTFPDEMWCVFIGAEGIPIVSANESTEEEAKARLASFKVKWPTTTFGYCKYVRLDAPPGPEPET